MSRWASNTTWVEFQGSKSPKKRVKECVTSHWEPAMTRWASNTTWHEPKGGEPPQKEVKKARHVALGPRYVALDLQRDVAPQLQTPSY